jgi:hypothetical protein
MPLRRHYAITDISLIITLRQRRRHYYADAIFIDIT